MAKLRDNIEQNLPFISVLNYGEHEYVGIIINQDQFVTSFYDLNAIRTPEEKSQFLIIGDGGTKNLLQSAIEKMEIHNVVLKVQLAERNCKMNTTMQITFFYT